MPREVNFIYLEHYSRFKKLSVMFEMYKKRRDFRMAGRGHGIEGAAKHHYHLASKRRQTGFRQRSLAPRSNDRPLRWLAMLDRALLPT